VGIPTNVSMYEVIGNLIDNAIKYSGESKKILITSQLNQEGLIETAVQDFGVGIPTNVVPNLFTKFYRNHRNRAQIGGTGLGLYLCRRLAEIMGGRIWVESEFKKGSTFSIELPRISHEEANRLIETAAEQATTEATPAPVLTPTPVQQPITPPTISTPAPEVSVAPQQTPVSQTQPAPQTLATPISTPIGSGNIPLSAIEQHPEAYVQDRGQSINGPPRTPGGQN
jgi:hypothetical protein